MSVRGMIRYVEQSNLPQQAKASIAETYAAMRTPHGQLVVEKTSGHGGAALRMLRDSVEVGATAGLLGFLHAEFSNGLNDAPVDAMAWIAGSLIALAMPGTEISETAKNVYKTGEAVYVFRHIEALCSGKKGKPSKSSAHGESTMGGEGDGEDPVLAFGKKMKMRAA
jgi:hypothetical protein